MASSALSQTLQSITTTKIQELEKRRKAYAKQKDDILTSAEKESSDLRKRISILHAGVSKLDKHDNPQLHNIQSWIEQSAYDPTVPTDKLVGFEKELRAKLDVRSRKLDLADLYSQLLVEWISSGSNHDDQTPEDDSENPFEMVQGSQKERLEQLRDKFSRVVFDPVSTDEVEIDLYLKGLFGGEYGDEALKRLRRAIGQYGKHLLSEDFPTRLEDRSLKWCIKALLKNDLLNDEKKASLRDFLKDDAVLGEIKDVLNMRYRDLQNWEWNLGSDGMPVVPRQSLNGKWRVMMDEDVLQSLLTHWVGTMWAVKIKQVLMNVTQHTKIWRKESHLPEVERAKRQYYLRNYSPEDNIEAARQKTYRDDFFLAPLPSDFYEEAGGYDDDDDTPSSDRKSPKDIKQLLLRTLATEVIVRRSLDGEVAVVQSDFQWFATGIPHTSVFAVLRFMGMPEAWLDFFKKVLEPPLNMLNGEPVRTRKRGLPMAHIFEKLFGECVLFFMDLAVNQKTDMLLYRFHDDLWLVGKPQKCATAWQTMEEFRKLMGLDFNMSKTGSVYLTDGKRKKDTNVSKALPEGPVVMNFLVLDPESGHWKFNEEHVQEHVEQLQKQLAGSKTVLQWVKTWNSCIGRFFSYTFGEPAHCFGRDHLDTILVTHKKMQAFLFKEEKGTGTSVIEYLKNTIRNRFGVTDIPDAFLYMPETLGGLGLKNPFVPLLLLRRDLCDDPEAYMHKFYEDEENQYKGSKRIFEAMAEKDRRELYKEHFKNEYDDKPALSWDEAQTFMSFEDYTSYHECSSNLLGNLYTSFMGQPAKNTISHTKRVKEELQRLPYKVEGLEPDEDTSGEVDDPELLWIIEFYADELIVKCGGLEVVDRGLLPLGVLKAMKAIKVTWQMVL